MAPKTPEPRLLAEADHPRVAIPVLVAEPGEVQDPLVFAPAQTRDVEVAVGTPPKSVREHQVELVVLDGDNIGQGEHALGVVLARRYRQAFVCKVAG